MTEALLSTGSGCFCRTDELRDLETALRECETRLGRPATNLELCEELGMTLRELYATLDAHREIGLGRVDDCEETKAAGVDERLVRYCPDPGEDETCRVYSRASFGETMTRALDALPRNEKLVVSLHHNDDLSFGEIARVFGISEVRVAQIHTTAILRIRGKLLSPPAAALSL